MNTFTIKKRNENREERKFLFLFLSIVALYHVVLGIQGFDMCDEGWCLTGFQQIFNDPQSVQYLFLYYLSDFVGGLWNQLFGHFGYLSFRILTAIVMTALSWVVYITLRPYVNRWTIVAGLFWAFSCTSYGVMVFYHNYLSAFLIACVAWSTMKTLVAKSETWAFVTGMLLGWNIFVRLPNITLLSIVLVLIPFYIYNKDAKSTLRILLFSTIGLCSGIMMIVALMAILGHLDIFLDCIHDGFSAATDNESTHNIGEMLGIYLVSYWKVFVNMVLVMAIPIGTWLVYKSQESQNQPPRFALSNPWTCWLIAFAYFICWYFTSSNVFTLFAIATWVCIVKLLDLKTHPHEAYLAAIVLITMNALTWGSDYGIHNIGEYCVYLAGPFTLGIIRKQIETSGFRKQIETSGIRKQIETSGTKKQIKASSFHPLPYTFLAIAILFVGERGIRDISSQCYFDNGYRWHKTHLIDSPLATTFTTERNCMTLNPLLKELSKYVKQDDYLLCFQNIPTLHFLTKTRPYLRNPWVWSYDPNNMEQKFLQAEQTHQKLPVVVRDKSMVPNWQEYYPDWNNEFAENTYYHKNKKVALIKQFIERHHYQLVWENEVFQILLPPND